ncbi:ADP-ribosylation factor family-domain-containing protein [Scenedesmus sp. NREL 46B-D3]|nr:ADP-ribosylation factor family-domain-containing protein [Scenedesmus sp. NREL 46B-D3]
MLPTTGTELLKLPPVKAGLLPRGLILREVGGQMQPIWHHYYDEAAAVLFVVDAAQTSSLADAAMLLFDLLQDQHLQGKPLCVLLNKRDRPGALSQSQLDGALRLHDLRLSHPGRLQVLVASGLYGQGLPDIMKWLAAAAAAADAASLKHR